MSNYDKNMTTLLLNLAGVAHVVDATSAHYTKSVVVLTSNFGPLTL